MKTRRSRTASFGVILWLMALAASAPAETYYVDGTSGVDSPSRGTSNQPWKSINYAFDHVTGSGASHHSIYVASGIYQENVVMDPYESLYGGYAPSTWVRNPAVYETTIDGRSQQHAVVCANGTVIDGFVISGGSSDNGGGLYCSNISCTISDNIINGNVALQNGGGIYINGGNVTVTSCTIEGNVAAVGAGIYQSGGSTSLSGIRFVGNSHVVGRTGSSAFHVVGGISTLTNCRFLRNNMCGAIVQDLGTLTVTNSVIAENVGGLECAHGNIVVRGCLISNNASPKEGVGIKCYGIEATGAVENCIICNNKTTPGPIIQQMGIGSAIRSVEPSNFTVRDCVFANNVSFPDCPSHNALYLGTPVIVENCMIVGGESFFLERIGQDEETRLVNNTIVKNGTPGFRYKTNSQNTVRLTNDILWGNSDDISIDLGFGGKAPLVSCCNIGDGDFNGENGTISVNPDFWTKPDAGSISQVSYDSENCLTTFDVSDRSFAAGKLKGCFLWVENTSYYVKTNTVSTITVYGNASGMGYVGKQYSLEDYHLIQESLCVDVGSSANAPNHDIDGDPRPIFGRIANKVDIGADEYKPPPPTRVPAWTRFR